MPLHLLKLSVGSESVETMARWQATRLARDGTLYHETRNFPRRAEEILNGGSIYWIIKGYVRVRQQISALERRADEDRGRFCRIVLDPDLVLTEIQPRRPHQGWRYLDAADATVGRQARGDPGRSSRRNGGRAARAGPAVIFEGAAPTLSNGRAAIAALYRVDETARVRALMEEAEVSHDAREAITGHAQSLVERIRADQQDEGGMDAFMVEYELSSEEGIVLMCLAEALLRIPDADTQDRLIRDKIGGANWQSHLGQSPSWFVNASTWGLMLSGRVLRWENRKDSGLGRAFARIVSRSGEPVIRQAIVQAMRILGRQFVMGQTIDDAMDRARGLEERGNRLSYDMLGEAARTAADADRYFEAYFAAIGSIGRRAADFDSPVSAPGLSVKLSALHPRYDYAQREAVMSRVAPRLMELAREAKSAGIGLTVDAEEADRLDLSLDIFETVAADSSLAGWDGLGLAVQAYQKRATAVIDWLAALAAKTGRQLPVRLVKGAYWDTEIKRGQERGLEGYPVFTRKASTDVSYIACAKRMLADEQAFYPAFATHNALTLATIPCPCRRAEEF